MAPMNNSLLHCHWLEPNYLPQEDSGGPLMCSYKNRYSVVGIISSGKGWVMSLVSCSCLLCLCSRCGSYPGLYTDVARYVDWINSMINLLENEIEWNDPELLKPKTKNNKYPKNRFLIIWLKYCIFKVFHRNPKCSQYFKTNGEMMKKTFQWYQVSSFKFVNNRIKIIRIQTVTTRR